MQYTRLLAVDPSLACSGWAFFALKDGELLGVGKIRSNPPGEALATRLADLQRRIGETLQMLRFGPGDVLVCEAPTTMRDPKAALKVENVRGIFETIARERGGRVPGRLNPRTVQYELMGLRGKQISRPLVKEIAVRTTHALFGEALQAIGFSSEPGNLSQHQDIVDAILVGSVAVSRVRSLRSINDSIEALFEVSTQSSRRRWS